MISASDLRAWPVTCDTHLPCARSASPVDMSVALQLGSPSAAGGPGWPAEPRLCGGVGQQRRPPAHPPGRRFSLITLVNVIHSDRPMFAAPGAPPPTTPSPPQPRQKDARGSAGEQSSEL